MQFVGHGRGDDNLRIAGDLEGTAFAPAVGQAAAPQFDIVFGRHDDFRMRVDLIVGAPELCAAFRKDHFVVIGALQGRLIGGGPDVAAVCVAQIAERAPVVAGAVFAPARDGQVPPAAGARAAIGDHHVVAAVGQQLDFGNGRVGGRITDSSVALA
ncbi:hypothetical protein G6F63_015088 [Rhizopus arrhizus]|nr:hypothetical protein G6F63_015088 [Rhizopus arrhizus]